MNHTLCGRPCHPGVMQAPLFSSRHLQLGALSLCPDKRLAYFRAQCSDFRSTTYWSICSLAAKNHPTSRQPWAAASLDLSSQSNRRRRIQIPAKIFPLVTCQIKSNVVPAQHTAVMSHRDRLALVYALSDRSCNYLPVWRGGALSMQILGCWQAEPCFASIFNIT